MARILTAHMTEGAIAVHDQEIFYTQGTITFGDLGVGNTGNGGRKYAALNFGSGGVTWRFTLLGDYTELYGAIWFREGVSFPTGIDHIVRFNDDGVKVATFRFDGGQRLVPMISTVEHTAGDIVLAISQWYCLEFHLHVNASGVLETKINGVADATYSGDTTVGAASVNQVDICSGFNTAQYICGLVINDTSGSENNTWPGRLKLAVQDPDSDDGSINSWTGSSGGSKYALLDETPPNESDYIYTATNAQRQAIGFAASGLGSNVSPKNVIHKVFAKKITDGQLKIGMLQGGNEAQTAALDLPVSYQVKQYVRAKNPDTTSDWTVSAIDANEVTLEAVI